MTISPLLLTVAFAAMFASGALVPLLVRFAVGRNLLDMPNTRSSHEVPTPRLGGVAVIVGTWAGFIVLLAVASESTREALPLVVAATVVGLVGLADDFLNLHFGVKAGVQALTASVLLVVFPPPIFSDMPVALRIILLVIGVFWVVALCNAFNFMDGIDGITGGVVVISALFVVAVSGEAAGFLIPLSGAAVGFLVWNIGPASIFMGDAGSYFTGFALAVAAVYVPSPGSGEFLITIPSLLACLLIFTPYLFDTGFTILRRLASGAGGGVFSAHREHIYQRITPAPSMHRRTSSIYYGLSVLCGVAALAVAAGGSRITFGVFGVCIAAGCCLLMLALPRLLGDKAVPETRRETHRGG